MNDLSICLFCKKPTAFICPFDGIPMCADCWKDDQEQRTKMHQPVPDSAKCVFSDADRAAAISMKALLFPAERCVA